MRESARVLLRDGDATIVELPFRRSDGSLRDDLHALAGAAGICAPVECLGGAVIMEGRVADEWRLVAVIDGFARMRIIGGGRRSVLGEVREIVKFHTGGIQSPWAE